MTLEPGSRLGPYEIAAKLGEGGMGEVYRATDFRLKRQVAIKVLPTAFTEDPDRLARFEREAQLLAQLQHPKIASVYGLEESGGVRALVMELVEGSTLDERMQSQALPEGEALATALQIAQALEEAHEKGIVHRDLKPQNVKVTAEGDVKVLDFGLAKAMSPAADSTSLTDLAHSPTLMNSPTLTALPGTQLGVILGTAAYMAPEQARGAVVDKRADIWAFGVVLFEMLSGQSLFAAATVTDTLAGVLKTDVDFGRLPRSTPAAIRRLLRRCLERDPRDRLRDIGDARIVIAETLAGGVEEDDEAIESEVLPTTPRSRGATVLPWMLALLTTALATWAWLGTRQESPPPQRTVATILPPDGTTYDPSSPPVLSPDGRSVVLAARDADYIVQLWLYSLDDGSFRLVPGSVGGTQPFWSPDSDAVGFFTATQPTQLVVTRLDEGVSTVLAPISGQRYSGVWGPGDEIRFGHTKEVYRISARGGPVERIEARSASDPGRDLEFLALSLSPSGTHYSLLVRDFSSSEPDNEVRIGTWNEESPRPVLASNSGALFAPSGDLVWWDEGHLWAQPLDTDRLVLTGERRLLQSDVQALLPSSLPMASIAGDGTLVFRSGAVVQDDELALVDRQGRILQTVGPPGRYYMPQLSPDGSKIAVDRSDETFRGDIWVFDIEKNIGTRLTSAPENETGPVWSPDGRELVICSSRFGRAAAHRIPLEAREKEERIFGAPEETVSPRSWSPTGWIAMGVGRDLVGWSLESGETIPIATTPSNERGAHLSPDGLWVVYVSDETGQDEIYLQTFPAASSRARISIEGGSDPSWRPDGGEIYFVDERSRIIAVPVLGSTRDGLPELGPSEPLFRLDFKEYGAHNYDTNDGQTFLVVRGFGARAQRPVTLVLNALPAR